MGISRWDTHNALASVIRVATQLQGHMIAEFRTPPGAWAPFLVVRLPVFSGEFGRCDGAEKRATVALNNRQRTIGLPGHSGRKHMPVGPHGDHTA